MQTDSPALKSKRTKYGKEGVAGVLFAMTPVLGFFIFGFIPMVVAVIIAFFSIRGYNFEGMKFVGYQNFVDIFTNRRFGLVIKNTMLASLAMPLTLAASLVISLLLHRNKKGTKVFRTILFIPYVCSIVAITTMWRWIFDENYGILNTFLQAMGAEKIGWVSDSKYFMSSLNAMSVWAGTGFGVILYSASLGNVPKTYYEAAQIDGASGLRQFFKITLPMISPTTFFLITVGLIGAFQDFTRFQAMDSAAGPNESGLTVVFWLYRMGFTNVTTQGMGMASALAVFWTIVIIIISRISFWLSRYWVHYD